MKTERPISLRIAAARAGVTPETIARWCREFGIGKQMKPGNPWRVDPVELDFVIEGDRDGLDAFRAAKDGRRNGEH